MKAVVLPFIEMLDAWLPISVLRIVALGLDQRCIDDAPLPRRSEITDSDHLKPGSSA